ncbi:hypothetical protein HPP92_004817 [Vanilla planifolia]|uniref:Aspergillus nuclease S1 n=1 Tax=Vanilla planifolia TaxID=51239 RepID=A0A835RHK3_VANPL|nr:hypothetical protein HPP92_004817 [Vanilla planifolia]
MASTFHIASVFTLIFSLPVLSHGWGTDGHYIVCQIAQQRLSDAAARAVNELLPDYAKGNLSSLCSWADHVKFMYPWSSELHYIDIADDSCTYNYSRDCKDKSGVQGRCVSGAIFNYTSQLRTHGNYNLTQALLFLSHFMGDIHQPLHVAHTSDKGGNTIDVQWYHKKTVLHHVWDDSIIDTAEDHFYGNEVDKYIDALQRNITGEWSSQIPKWQSCSGDKTTCPDIYASESISAACDWAYKGVTDGAVLEDEYFNTRLPIVDLRLAQAGVRLAATLNRIFS